MKVTYKTKGFKELEQALANELPKATARNAMRRAATNAMKHIESRAKQLAPRDEGALADSITTKNVKAKRTSRTRYAKSDGIAVATGPTSRRASDPGGNAAWQEFGTVDMPANPYMRPAADGEAPKVISDVREELASQIEKAKARIARKAAKAGR